MQTTKETQVITSSESPTSVRRKYLKGAGKKNTNYAGAVKHKHGDIGKRSNSAEKGEIAVTLKNETILKRSGGNASTNKEETKIRKTSSGGSRSRDSSLGKYSKYSKKTEIKTTTSSTNKISDNDKKTINTKNYAPSSQRGGIREIVKTTTTITTNQQSKPELGSQNRRTQKDLLTTKTTTTTTKTTTTNQVKRQRAPILVEKEEVTTKKTNDTITLAIQKPKQSK